MDYIGKKCAVCDRYFHADDDIVVCPECGTPHHRACYEERNECVNIGLHESGYDYAAEHAEHADEHTRCTRCGTENDKDAFFCKKCGSQLTAQSQQDTTRQAPYGSNGAPNFAGAMFDPMAGVDNGFDLGDGVTAGEAAKYVKQNTPYFIRIFSNIRSASRSRFNFAAAIFTGGYLLYRKMYKIGAVIISIQLLMLLLVTYIYQTAEYNTIFSHISTLYTAAGNYTAAAGQLMEYMASLSPLQNFMIILPAIYELIQVTLMITIGACANRLYFSHCKKQIVKIKSATASAEEAENLLQTKGGVNTALAVSLLVTYILIDYLPAILTMF